MTAPAARVTTSEQIANPGVEVVGSTSDYAAGVLENYLFINWRRRIVVDGGYGLGRGFESVRESHPNRGIMCVVTVQHECQPYPEPALREVVEELLTEYKEDIEALAITHEGAGFQTTLMRSVATAVHLASRIRFSNRVFPTTEAAATWLAQQGQGPHLSVERVCATIGYLRTC